MTDSKLPAPTPCKYMVSGLFHSPSGVLFTFPSRYSFTIDLSRYLALSVSTDRFPQAIHVSWYSRIQTKKCKAFQIRDYYPLWCTFPGTSSMQNIFDFSQFRKTDVCILQPPSYKMTGLGFSGFARRYLRNNYCSLFLWVLRCFTSPGLLDYLLRVIVIHTDWVAPFGDPRIKA